MNSEKHDLDSRPVIFPYLVVPGMKADGSYKVDVLKAAETFAARDVPKPNRFVHRRSQDEVVLKFNKVLLLSKRPYFELELRSNQKRNLNLRETFF
jgi:hypothetical protein